MKHKWMKIHVWIKLVICVIVIFVITVVFMITVNRKNLNSLKAETDELSYYYLTSLKNIYSNDLRSIINVGISLRYNEQFINAFEYALANNGAVSNGATLDSIIKMVLLNRNIKDVLLVLPEQKAFYCLEKSNLEIYQELIPETVFDRNGSTSVFTLPRKHLEESYRYSGPLFLYAIDVNSYPNPSRTSLFLGKIVFMCGLKNYQDIIEDNIAFRISMDNHVLLNRNFTGTTQKRDNTYSLELPYSNWLMELCFTPGQSRHMQITEAISAIVILGLSIVVIYTIVYNEIHHPLKTLMDEIRHMTPSDNQVTVCPFIDIGEVCEHINHMLNEQQILHERNEQMIEDKYELMMRHRQTQLSALRSQINPHFLYNTLECISGMASVHKVSSIQDITVSLANIFRYAIQSSDNVPLRQEISIISDYGKIISARFAGAYTLSIDVDPSMMDLSVPRMILQPLVENAVEHGFREKASGQIWVRGWIRNDQILFEVENDGTPINRERLDEIRAYCADSKRKPEKGIGIINVVRRLQLLYGDSFSMTIDSESGKHTVFRLLLSLKPSLETLNPTPNGSGSSAD